MGVRTLITFWAIACIPLLFGACKSATERIALSSEQIHGHSANIADTAKHTRDLARVSGNRFVQIESQVQSKQPDLELIASEATAGADEQEQIVSNSAEIIGLHGEIAKSVGEVNRALTGVQDITPWWADAIVYALIATSIIGLSFLVWYTGVGGFVRRLLGLVTPRARREAEIAAATLDTEDPTTIREFVAAKRGLDPEFDRAFRKLWKRHREAAASLDQTTNPAALGSTEAK